MRTSSTTIGTIGRNVGCTRMKAFFFGALSTEMACMPATPAPPGFGTSRRRARNSFSSSSSCSLCSSIIFSGAGAFGVSVALSWSLFSGRLPVFSGS